MHTIKIAAVCESDITLVLVNTKLGEILTQHNINYDIQSIDITLSLKVSCDIFITSRKIGKWLHKLVYQPIITIDHSVFSEEILNKSIPLFRDILSKKYL